MKKIIFTTALAVLSFFSGYKADAQFSLGARAGLNFSTFSGELPDDIDRRWVVGPKFGAIVNYGFTDVFSIQGEINYSMQGGQTMRYPTIEDERMALGYINVPLLAKFTFGDENFRYFVNAGPYAGFAARGRLLGDDYSEVVSTYDAPVYRRDYGFAVGAGVMYPMGPGNILFEARYTHGIFDVMVRDGVRPNETPEGVDPRQTRVIHLSVGYLIPFGVH
ncbi:porin family protein [Cytophagaceae bacterium ABcell3]|nr:porin family protein [Cytophagaceae bacterium ABcell3]